MAAQAQATTTTSGLRALDSPCRPGDWRGRCRQLRLQQREVRLTQALLLVTALGIAVLVVQMGTGLARHAAAGELRALAGAALFDVLVLLLLYGNVAFQVARLGGLRRAPLSPDGGDGPGHDPLVVLVPSYCEQLSVVRQTLLSAALLAHSDRRVVLLLDDPPMPRSDSDRIALERARALPGEVAALLEPQAARLREAFVDHQERREAGAPLIDEPPRLAVLYDSVADWLSAQAVAEPVRSPTDELFVRLCWTDRAASCREIAAAWRRRGGSDEEVEQAYRELATMFDVRLTCFERKRFANLSHEPNKAMNLNSYLSLLGGRYRVVDVAGERQLVRVTEGPSELDVPDATWVLTLDADSLLTSDYTVRLLTELRRPGNERLAVIQTPYSAVPGATTPLERIAGATTDVMHLVHQGATHFGSTYWVGANALLRRAALADIATTDVERGHPVTRFIQDRTVIEDTESSIDLIDRGWTLHNYPARLAYSATPADYGSLLVQRRRWANGGLVILPKCLRYLWRTRAADGLVAALLRVHYLVSIAAVNVSLVLLMLVPFEDPLRNPLLPATCLPYFFLYARDLKRSGYRYRDLPDVYALNLLLLPVNLGGVLKSLQQACTGRRIPFGRTPKVADRTAAPRLYVAATMGLLAVLVLGTVMDLLSGRGVHAVAVASNAVVLGYAVTRFMGWRCALADLLPRTRSTPEVQIPAQPIASTYVVLPDALQPQAFPARGPARPSRQP